MTFSYDLADAIAETFLLNQVLKARARALVLVLVLVLWVVVQRMCTGGDGRTPCHVVPEET